MSKDRVNKWWDFKKYTNSDNESIKAFQTEMITSDTLSLENAISILNREKSIKSLIVEYSFPSELEKLAINTKHLTPNLLLDGLKSFKRDDIINHIKPSYEEKIIKEIVLKAQ